MTLDACWEAELSPPIVLLLEPGRIRIPSPLLPWAVTPLMMIGGLYLCYEGFEKVAHKLLHKPQAPITVPFADVSVTIVRGRP